METFRWYFAKVILMMEYVVIDIIRAIEVETPQSRLSNQESGCPNQRFRKYRSETQKGICDMKNWVIWIIVIVGTMILIFFSYMIVNSLPIIWGIYLSIVCNSVMSLYLAFQAHKNK